MGIKILKKNKDGNILCDIKKKGRRTRIKLNSEREYILLKSILRYLEDEEVKVDSENIEIVKMIIRSNLYPNNCSQLYKDEFDFVFEKAITVYDKLNCIDLFLDDDKKILDEKVPIKDEKILKILLLGRYGSGKSSMIKALINIKDEEDIFAIDTFKATTYKTTYVLRDLKSSGFKFIVLFKKSTEIFIHVEECVLRGIYALTERIISGTLEDSDKLLQDHIMKKFVVDPKNIFRIECILGKYYSYGSIKKMENKEQSDLWDYIYKLLLNLVFTIFNSEFKINKLQDINLMDISILKLKQYILESLQKDERVNNLYNDIIEYILEKLIQKKNAICNQMQENELGKIIKNKNEEIIGFYNLNYDPIHISEYLKPFTSISSKDFTKIITPLVREMRIEVPYNKSIDSNIRQNTIAITDTVGFDHIKQNDTSSLGGSVDINYTNFDIIAIFDIAKSSMDSTTENILADVYRNVMKDKIMLVYSHYDKFNKKDFESENDKENYLLSLQDITLRKIENSNSMSNFAKNLRDRTIYLKDIKGEYHENLKYSCINKFLKISIDQWKRIHDSRRIKLINNKKSLIDFYYHKLSMVYNITQEEFIKQQNYIYNIQKPSYETIKALTNYLSIGKSRFEGETITLKPIDDFMKILTEQIDKFLKNPKEINFTSKDDVEILNYIEKIEDFLKERIIQKLKDNVKERVVVKPHKFWEELNKYDGDKSDKKRLEGIMCLYNKIFPCLELSNISFADYWIKKIEEIINESLDEVISELK